MPRRYQQQRKSFDLFVKAGWQGELQFNICLNHQHLPIHSITADHAIVAFQAGWKINILLTFPSQTSAPFIIVLSMGKKGKKYEMDLERIGCKKIKKRRRGGGVDKGGGGKRGKVMMWRKI